MLSSFTIKNFRSIVDLTVDFTYGEGKAPNGYQQADLLPFIESSAKERLVPCMAFFGANASGKTNILKAVYTLKNLVAGEISLASGFDPNVLNKKYQDTTFSLKFILGENIFEYTITYDAGQIISEILQKDGKPLFEINRLEPKFSKQLLTQGYSAEKLTEILRVECSDGEGRQTKLFLNRIGLGYQGLDRDMRGAFFYFNTTLHVHSNNDTMPLSVAVTALAPLYNNDEKAVLAEIVDIVQQLDIDILGIDINRKELSPLETGLPARISVIAESNGARVEYAHGKRHVLAIATSHKDALGQRTIMDFYKNESAGTQRLAGLVAIFLGVIKTGSVLFIDELESSLHPLLMRELVLLFKKRSRNAKDAQLIFTTHNTDILDDSILRVSEIALTRKNLPNGTMIRRLVDLKNKGDDIRNVTNFRKQYLAGFYSGIPHPAI